MPHRVSLYARLTVLAVGKLRVPSGITQSNCLTMHNGCILLNLVLREGRLASPTAHISIMVLDQPTHCACLVY